MNGSMPYMHKAMMIGSPARRDAVPLGGKAIYRGREILIAEKASEEDLARYGAALARANGVVCLDPVRYARKLLGRH